MSAERFRVRAFAGYAHPAAIPGELLLDVHLDSEAMAYIEITAALQRKACGQVGNIQLFDERDGGLLTNGDVRPDNLQNWSWLNERSDPAWR
jgi:hypothetical protein